MANFKISSTLLCVLLIGQDVFAVINKLPTQSTGEKDDSNKKDQISAEDRVLSDVYGAPTKLSNDYGPPPSGGGSNGPAPIYGPPELTGNHGPVQIYPPPPPELPPPPPPQSFGGSRKPKPHFGPPQQSFGPPPPIFGPKPNYGLPKQHFGGPPSFGSSRPPKPHYGPPLKFSGPPNHQFGPPNFGSSIGNGHGAPIPISLETYGPPVKEASLPFDHAPQREYGTPAGSISASQSQHGPPASDLYGPPPPPPAGVPAPPTPPDIKYDGWQPIAGLVGAPNQHESASNSFGIPDNSYGPPLSNNENLIAHGSSSEASNVHSSGSHSSSLQIESGQRNVPSNSYGEPLHNPEAQHLQSSVHESTNSHGLPPPALPQSEPLHNNQGPAKSIPGLQEQYQHHESNNQNHQFGNSDLSVAPYDNPLIGDLKPPGYEILPGAADLHGLTITEGGTSFGSSSSSSFASSSTNAFHNDVGSALSLPELPLETYGTPLISSGNQHELHGSGDGRTFQQLPLHGSSIANSEGASSSAGSFRGHGHSSYSHGHSSHSQQFPGSLSGPSASYLPSNSHSSASWLSPFNLFGMTNLKKNPSNGHGHYNHKNHGTNLRHGPNTVSGNLIPPRNRAPIKFRERIPSGILANLHRYLPPSSKPSINYGAPIEQHLPSANGPHSFKSSFPNSFHNVFASGSSSDNSVRLNSPIAAPHVRYGTPLSFNNFNTPTPVLTYGAPNFGPGNSFITKTFGGFGASGNLYSNVASSGIGVTYGTPIQGGVSSIHGGGGGLFGGHDCGFQKSVALASSPGQYNNFLEDAGRLANSGAYYQSFANSAQSSDGISTSGHTSHSNHQQNHQQQQQQQQQNSLVFDNVGTLNSGLSNEDLTNFQSPSIHELDLESHEHQEGELKDSYGNPIGLSSENVDQSVAALTNNDIHAKAVASHKQHHQQQQQQQQQHQQNQNSYAPLPTFPNGNGAATVESLTAALTAQGYGRTKTFASNEIVQETNNQYSTIHEGGNEALALALQAEGADGFQIQGSKGTYTLQIHAADGGLGTENSDGSIRHDQVLSNGLLQDILAAIEQPGNGPVQIQGAPQPQLLQEVYDDAIANAASNQQHASIHHHQQQQQNQHDIAGSHNEIVQQVLTVQGNDGTRENHEKSLNNENQAALFYINGGYDETRKEIRSTSSREGQASLSSNDKSYDETNGGQAETTKKSL